MIQKLNQGSKYWTKIHNSILLRHPIHAGRSPTAISLPLIFVIHRGLKPRPAYTLENLKEDIKA